MEFKDLVSCPCAHCVAWRAILEATSKLALMTPEEADRALERAEAVGPGLTEGIMALERLVQPSDSERLILATALAAARDELREASGPDDEEPDDTIH